MSQPHICETCYFFRVHYAKDDNGQLCKLKQGHCTNKEMAVMRFRRCFKYGGDCGYWHTNEDAEQVENINDIIKETAKRIERIAAHFDID